MAIADTNRVAHPLDPLTPAEITAAVALVRADGRLTGRARFATVALAEPPKDQVPGPPDHREARLPHRPSRLRAVRQHPLCPARALSSRS
ncbi:MAG: Copper amine oxidase, domain [Solirubrobacterales bacterium]|jgi:primary-amine oxidase|nr:Copper amine oxidase, domain [Solirubrobacterales bacterium]